MFAKWMCITVSLSLLVHSSHQVHWGNISNFDTWYSSNSSGSVDVRYNATECYKPVANTLDSSSVELDLSEHVSLSVKRQGQRCLFSLNISDIKNGIARLYVQYRPIDKQYGSITVFLPENFSKHHIESNTICHNVNLTSSADSSITDLIVTSPFKLSPHAEDLNGGRHWFGAYVLTYTLVLLDGSTSTGKYAFMHPQHLSVDNLFERDFKPFYYLDIANDDVLHVRIHPVPELYGKTDYRIALCRRDEEGPIDTVNLTRTQKLEYVWTHFVKAGYYYVDVVLANREPVCSANTTREILYFEVGQSGMVVFTMIISLSWIPFAVIFGLYYIGKYWRNSGRNRQKVLLISSPTRDSHIEVMKSLTNYLRECKIDAFIGELDIQKLKDDLERPQPNVGLWLAETFKKVDIIIWATSPEYDPDKPPTPIFANIDKRAIHLVIEYSSSRQKTFWVVRFPSHKLESIPPDFPKSTVFHVPRDLDRLVKSICSVRVGNFPRASKTDLLMKIEATKNPAATVPMELQNMLNKQTDMKTAITTPTEDYVPLMTSSNYFSVDVNLSKSQRNSMESVNWSPCPEYEESDASMNRHL